MGIYSFMIPANTPKVPANKHWQFCVGSGQAKLALRTDYAKQLKLVHDELGIKRVRFHGIFDDSMQALMGLDDFMPLPGAKNFKNYNFHNIGIAYDNVLAAGMQPWVELSFMPSRLAKGDKKVTVNSDGKCSLPKSDEEWADFIQAFIRYLLHRYGAGEVEQWFFEVWNEPNMSTFFNGTQDDYFHLYEITAKAVKAVDPNIRVGGPASATGAWITEFIDFCEKGQIPVDFISTHNYPGDGIGEVFLPKIMFDSIVGGMQRLKKIGSGRTLTGVQAMMTDKSEASEMPKGQMHDHTKRIAEQVAGRYPLYYTEWNCNAILSSPTNDTRKVACFQLKSACEMEPYVTGSSIWAFSDIFDEFLLMPDQFQGGFGLLTADGIPKPQFYALKLLSQTGDQKYDLPYTNDEVEISAYESETQIHIFVYRQRMKNLNLPAEEYELSLELSQAPADVKLVRIDRNHCNPLKEWKKMGCPQAMNDEEIAELIGKTKMQEEPVETVYEDGKLKLGGKIGVNDVHAYIIDKA